MSEVENVLLSVNGLNIKLGTVKRAPNGLWEWEMIFQNPNAISRGSKTEFIERGYEETQAEAMEKVRQIYINSQPTQG